MTQGPPQPIFCHGLAEIAGRYAGLIVDQWGVLHDGGLPYPGAIACLAALRRAGRRVVLLSNSGKRAANNRARMIEMGFDQGLFDAIVTSGEATWQALRQRTDPVFASLGRRCFLWSRGGDLAHVEGLDLQLVEHPAEADFLYLAGVEDHAPLTDFLDGLEQGARRGLPMICANPDITAIYPNGGRGMAPGVVAQHYESLGGIVVYVGKPHRPVYELCLTELGAIPKAEILAIGDSLEHDIAGGQGIGVDTALITSGVHREAFAQAGPAALADLALEYRATPRWALPSFTW